MELVHLMHDRLATTVMIFFLVVGLWGLLEFARGGAIGGSIAGALVIGQVLVVVQGLFGLALFVDGQRPEDPVHILYGAAAALAGFWCWHCGRSATLVSRLDRSELGGTDRQGASLPIAS